jgi:hypothetical protein
VSLRRRVAAVERALASPGGGGRDRFDAIVAGWGEAWRRDVEAFLPHVPADLRDAVRVASRGRHGDAIASWIQLPFARWAGPLPADYRFPRRLVEWMVAPPGGRSYFMGTHCGRCGLSVPLITHKSDDPDRPADLRAFPSCPACGGPTSFGANWRCDREQPA